MTVALVLLAYLAIVVIARRVLVWATEDDPSEVLPMAVFWPLTLVLGAIIGAAIALDWALFESWRRRG